MATPTTSQTDAELIRQYVRDRSESAFQILTGRHIHLVYGTACRRTGDPSAAEEIAQNVFIALARKAAWLQQLDSLAAWLHQTTLLESRQWWRGETRRRDREKQAADLETTMKTSHDSPNPLAPVLDEALLDLPESERQAVLLRFFERLSHRQIGEALGIGEDAARKRVEKALEHTTALLRKRGVVAGSGATLAGLMASASQAAPVGLTGTVAAAALASGTVSTASWLAALLGMSRGWLTSICVAVCLVPAAWQQARLLSARGEAHRLEELLSALQMQSNVLSSDLELARQKIAQIGSRPSTSRADQTTNDGTSGNLEERLYLWDEKTDYVRIPKSLLKRIGFESTRNKFGLHTGQSKVIDMDTGRVSTALLDALGLSLEQKEQVRDIVARERKTHTDRFINDGYLTEVDNLPDGLTLSANARAIMSLNPDTRVWVVPPTADSGTAVRARVLEEMTACIGKERAEVIIQMAMDDNSLRSACGQFGAATSYVIVTPCDNGTFTLCQNTTGYWNYNIPVPYSTLSLKPGEEVFDEAAIRKDLLTRMEQYTAQNPGKEIPNIEDIVTESRWQFEQHRKENNVILMTMGRPLPDAVVNYLNQWKASHSNATSSKP
jgi:RNA polymerase sigma factor (sigma-70 family)